MWKRTGATAGRHLKRTRTPGDVLSLLGNRKHDTTGE